MNNRAIIAAFFVMSFAACGSTNSPTSSVPDPGSPTLSVRVMHGNSFVAGRIVYHAPTLQSGNAPFATTDSSGTVVFAVALGQQICVWTLNAAANTGRISQCVIPANAATTVVLLVP